MDEPGITNEDLPQAKSSISSSMRPLLIKPLFSLLATSHNPPFLWLIELAAS